MRQIEETCSFVSNRKGHVDWKPMFDEEEVPALIDAPQEDGTTQTSLTKDLRVT